MKLGLWNWTKNRRGSVMLEALVAVAIFGIGASSIVYLILGSLETTRSGSDYTSAQEYLNEGWEAVRSIGTNNYNNLAISPSTYGVDSTSGEWVFSGTNNSDGYFTRTIDVNPVYRDVSGDIAPAGTLDINLREIIVTVSWFETPTKQRTVSSTFYFSNWDSDSWFEDTVADFSDGTFTLTEGTNNDDGEVALESVGGGSDDWGCVEQSASYDISGTADYYDLDYDDSTLYLVRASDTGSELVILNVTNPDSPSLLGSLDLVTTANAIKFLDDYVYIATIQDNAELMVVDVSNPGSLAIDTAYDATGTANGTDVVVEGNRAYLSLESSAADEFLILDITTPLSPTFIDSYDVGDTIGGMAIDTTNDVAFLATSGNARELTALDISVETAIALHSEYDIPGLDNGTDVALDDTNNYAIVTRTTDTGGEIFIINVSDPTSMSAETNLEAGGDALGVYVSGDYALVVTADAGNGLIAIDFSDPTTASILSTSAITGNANAIVAAANHRLYVATGSNTEELMIYQASGGWGCPVLAGSYNATGITDAVRIDLVGDTLYMLRESATTDELVILDVTDRSVPTLLGSLNLGATGFDIDVSGNYAYIATSGTELLIVDISNPASLSIDGSYDASGSSDAYAVVVNGNRAYLGRNSSNQDELWILDISTPTSPSLLDSFDTGDDVNSLAYTGGYLYVASDHNTYTFENYDVSGDTFSWVDYIQYSTANLDDLYLVGNYAYLARETSAANELIIVDISNPASLIEVGSVNLNASGWEVWSDGTYAYVGNSLATGELAIVDVSNPNSPTVIKTIDIPGGTFDVFGVVGDGNYVYAASESDNTELVIYEPYTSTGLSGTYIEDTEVEFDAGTYTDTQWDTDHVELDAAGIVAGTGTYTSQIFDSGQIDSGWGNLSWTENLATGSNLRMEAGTASATASFNTVNLQQTYTDPVVIPFYFESNNSDPMSVRIDNVTTTSFDIRLQDAGGSSPVSDTVHYLVVESGAHYLPDGTQIEAGHINTNTVASKAGGWNVGTNINYALSYSQPPVVLHSVMSENDSGWISTYISNQSSQNNPPDTTGFRAALNGAEATTTHGLETIGLVAFERGTGTFDGIDFESVNNGDVTQGHDNGCYTKNFSNSYSSAPIVIADQQEMDGGDGGWLVGCSGPTSSNYGEHVEEDIVGDAERAHTGETTSYIAFESAFDYAQAHDVLFQVRSCDDAACSGESFIGPDGTGGTYYTTDSGEALNVNDNQYFQYQVTFISGDSVTTPELYDVTFDFGPGGGGGGGAYETDGTYLSNAHDAGSTANWNTIEWNEDVSSCVGCNVLLQIRTASTQGGLSSELWQGPDGKDADETDFFTDPEGELIHTDHNGDQWIQYKATLSGDGSTTPYLEDIFLTYTNY